MLNRNHLEHVLKINGLSATAADEEIKSLLLSAHWHEDDVDTALTVLRENKVTHEDRIETKHHIFRSDQPMKPETISALLGIDVDMSSEDIKTIRYNRQHMSLGQMLGIAATATVLSVVCILALMWFYKFGIFHPFH